MADFEVYNYELTSTINGDNKDIFNSPKEIDNQESMYLYETQINGKPKANFWGMTELDKEGLNIDYKKFTNKLYDKEGGVLDTMYRATGSSISSLAQNIVGFKQLLAETTPITDIKKYLTDKALLPALKALKYINLEDTEKLEKQIAEFEKNPEKSKEFINDLYSIVDSENAKKTIERLEVLENYNNWIKDRIERNEFYKKENDINLLYDLTSGATSLLSQIGIGAMTGGAGVIAGVAVPSIGGAYSELRAKGFDVNSARGIAIPIGIGEGVLEKIGFDRIMKGMKGSGIAKRFIEGFISEGAEEALQSVWSNSIMTLAGARDDASKYETWKDIVSEALYEGMIGGILGGSVSSIGGAVSQKLQYSGVPKKQADKIAKDFIDKGGENVGVELLKNQMNSSVLKDGDVNADVADMIRQEQEVEKYNYEALSDIKPYVSSLLKASGISDVEINPIAELMQARANVAVASLPNMTQKDWWDSKKLSIEQTDNKTIKDVAEEVKTSNTETYNQSAQEYTIKANQLKVILETNPAKDDIHTWIRSIFDIKTFEEAMKDEESFSYPDFTKNDAERALKENKITIYSSNQIGQGVFITPSKMQAQDYAGNKKIYSKEINFNEVAWINADEGQYTGNIYKQGVRGQIIFSRDGNKIVLSELQNETTLLHEIGHLFAQDWIDVIRYKTQNNTITQQDKKELSNLESVLGLIDFDKGFTRTQHESFANNFLSYLANGETTNPQLKTTFEHFKEWLVNFFQTIKDKGFTMSKPMTDFYNSLLGGYEVDNKIDANVLASQIDDYQFVYDALKRGEWVEQNGISPDNIETLIESSKTDNKAMDFVKSLGLNVLSDQKTIRDLRSKEVKSKGNYYLAIKKQSFEKTKMPTEQEIENDIKKSQSKPLSEKIKLNTGVLETLEYAILGKDTRLKQLSEEVFNKVLKTEITRNLEQKQALSKIKPFTNNLAKLRKSNVNEYEKLSRYWYFGAVDKIQEIAKKNGFEKDFENVRSVLEDLYKKQKAVNIKIGYKEDYLPTKVKDFDGLMKVVELKLETDISKDIITKADKLGLTGEARAYFVNNYLRGFIPEAILLSPTNFTKAQKLLRDLDFYPYYQNFESTLQDYIMESISNIEQRKLFGKENPELSKSISDLTRAEKEYRKTEDLKKKEILKKKIDDLRLIVEDANNLEKSIGAFISKEFNAPDNKTEKIKNILTSHFIKKRSDSITRTLDRLNSTSSIYVLANFKSALKQANELGLSIYKNGFGNTFNALIHKNKIDVKSYLDKELNTEKHFDKFLDVSLKYTGFDLIDSTMKNIYSNANMLKTYQELKRNDSDINARIDMMFGKESAQLKQDILDGKITQNVIIYNLMELSNIQPITSLSKTELYDKAPHLRFAYTLKSYLIKQIGTVKNDIYNELKKGNIATATKNLAMFQTSLWLTGVPISMLTHFLFDDDDKEYDFTDAMLDNIMLNNIINNFNLTRLASGRIVDFVFGMTTPVFLRPLNDITMDLFDIVTGNFEKSRTLKNISIIKNAPNLFD